MGSCDPAGDVYYEQRLQFAATTGVKLNPFQPSEDDLLNMTNDTGIYSIFCKAVQDPANASNFALWMEGFFSGSIDGGAAYTGLMLAAGIVSGVGIAELMIPGATAAALAALANLPRTIVGLLKDILRTASKVAQSVKALVLRTLTWIIREKPSLIEVVAKGADFLIGKLKSLAHAARAVEESSTALGDLEKVAKIRILKARFPSLARDPAKAEAFELAVEHGIDINFERFAASLAKDPAFIKGVLSRLAGWNVYGAKVDKFFTNEVSKILSVGARDFKLTIHAAARMAKRGIPESAVREALERNPFTYLREGYQYEGYFNSATNTFVATIEGRVTTIIQGSGVPRYVALRGGMP